MCKFLFIAMCLTFSNNLIAQFEVIQFKLIEHQELYEKLIQELRCLVCPNQSLADSDADLAKDLRGKVREMILIGKDYKAIIKYMVDRYGQFILYKPKFSGVTLILWIAPFFLLGVICCSAIYIVRKQELFKFNTLPQKKINQVELLMVTYKK